LIAIVNVAGPARAQGLNPNFAPQQFTSDNDILAAAAAGQITLVQTNTVFECAVVSHKVVG
jgi:hypothetical protein